MGAPRVGDRLPVPVSPFGPMGAFGFRVHDLNLKGDAWEALRAADGFECVATLAGDERAVTLLIQGRMYALQAIDRWQEALLVGERLLERHRASGDQVSEAKTLADVADTLVRLSRLDEGLHHLAQSGRLLEQSDRRHARYGSALASLSEAARGMELYELADEAFLLAVELGGNAVSEAGWLEWAELLVEWGLRLEHIGRTDEATAKLARGAAIARKWVQQLAAEGPDADSPWARVVLAVALAKLDEREEALEIAAAAVLSTRERSQGYEGRLAHLAYGIALRASGDLPAARREFTAAIQLSTTVSQPTMQMIFRHELALLAASECPEPAAGELRSALLGQATRLWQLRLERAAMLRQARRRIDLEDARDRADDQAIQDPLTGLGNRRAFDRQLAAIDTGQDRSEPLVLMLLDLDRFKDINDNYSHSVGDRVLCQVAAVLRTHCRQEDRAIRFGGDEFAVLLRANLATAAQIAERIRRAVADQDWNELALGLRVTTSVGVAAFRPGMTGRQWFDAADDQLYAAKHSGRNTLAA